MKSWYDATSYARGDAERKPTAWETRTGALRITITCAHIYYPGKWVMHCHALGIDTQRLEAKDAESAKTEALRIAESVIDGLKADLKKLKA